MENNGTAPTSRLAKGVIALLCVAIIVLGGIYLAQGLTRPGTTPSEGTVFQNATGNVDYIGTAACATCHEDRHASYLQTGHSRSFGSLGPGGGAGGGDFHHRASDLRYRIQSDGATATIEERVVLPSGATHILAKHPIKYVVGSGARVRTPLVEIDGFLHRGPVSWYATKDTWDIAPGFESTAHPSFSGAVTMACLQCHAGRVERLDDSVHKFRVHEHAIGCERCHGPGELHAGRHTPSSGGDAKTSGPAGDRTIANPKRMSREQRIAVCAQCHMDPTLTVVNPGKRRSDWRPGLRWNDVMVTYRLEGASPDMLMGGHVEQLRESRCFQESKTMTCGTCHNPHEPPPREKDARRHHFNGKCLQCHDNCGRVPDDGPGVVPAEGDDCLQCHMERGPADRPHIAATHHRIKVPGLMWRPPEGGASIPTLMPLGDLSRLSKDDQDRNLGIAYVRLAGMRAWPRELHQAFTARSDKLMQKTRAEGRVDPDLLAIMAGLHYDAKEFNQATAMASQALALAQTQAMDPERRADALFVLSDIDLRLGKLEFVPAYLEGLSRIRRNARDRVALSQTWSRQGDLQKALTATKDALTIQPNDPDLHYLLADLYKRLGDARGAKRHIAIGSYLHKQGSIGAKFVRKPEPVEKDSK